MKKQWARQGLVILVLIMAIVSFAWTIYSIRIKSSPPPPKEASLQFLPDYQITSKEDLTAWPSGTVYEQGMAAYFYAAKPEVRVTPRLEILSLDQGQLNGTIRSTAEIRSVDDKSQIFWSYKLKETPEEGFTLSGVKPDAAKTAYSASDLLLDIPSAYELCRKIDEELLFQNGYYQMVITSYIHLDGTANGMAVNKDIVAVLPVSLQQGNFTISKTEEAMTSTVLNESNGAMSPKYSVADIIRTNWLPVTVALFFLSALLLLIVTGNRNLSKAAAEHRKFREWITEGSIDIKNKFSIHIFKLEGLVDLAIDLDKRVIHDSRVDNYYVLTEDIVYVYDPAHTENMTEDRQQLGRLLIEQGLITQEQLEIGIYYQKQIGRRLGESLLGLGFIDESTLYSMLAAQQGIDYYEMDPADASLDTDWQEKLSIKQARALTALPLGNREDKKPVIACGDITKEGIQNTLQKIFGPDTRFVAVRPSVIHIILNSLETQENKALAYRYPANGTEVPFERLTEKEREQFREAYYLGNIKHRLLLKAAGFVDPLALSEVSEKESSVNRLAGKNMISGGLATLLRGLDKATEAMNWESRHENGLPSLLDLLINANYLTAGTADWVRRELVLQGLPLEELLCRNYLTSEYTVKTAAILLDTLETILSKS